jgi:triacylglycerol lipase
MICPPPEFDIDIARECASLVQQAYTMYANWKAKQPWVLSDAYTNLATLTAIPEGLFPPNTPYGFVAKNNLTGNIFIAFRGTENWDDWISDFTVDQIDSICNWGKTESGFTKIYKQCSNTIHVAIKNIASKSNIFITGHSLGGGLAVLATADLVSSGILDNPTMYSFAGPRVGDINFSVAFNNRFRGRAWRIVNTEDLVPTLPLSTPDFSSPPNVTKPLHWKLWTTPKFNYLHVGTVVNFSVNKGNIPDNHDMKLYASALL